MSLILTTHPEKYITLLTLNRAEAANALNTALAEELKAALAEVAADKACRVLVLTGAGERVFSAGADLKERRGMDKAAWDAQHHAFEAAFAALAALEIPTIAAVNGAAIAGGLELALACDFMIAAPHATFAFTEASLGIMPGLGGTQRLPRAIGQKAGFEMLFTAKKIDAEKALALGLVNQVAENALQFALDMAKTISAHAPLSLRAIKKAVYEGSEMPLARAMELELLHYAELIDTQDRTEGINAYNEKRKPEFIGK